MPGLVNNLTPCSVCASQLFGALVFAFGWRSNAAWTEQFWRTSVVVWNGFGDDKGIYIYIYIFYLLYIYIKSSSNI